MDISASQQCSIDKYGKINAATLTDLCDIHISAMRSRPTAPYWVPCGRNPYFTNHRPEGYSYGIVEVCIFIVVGYNLDYRFSNSVGKSSLSGKSYDCALFSSKLKFHYIHLQDCARFCTFHIDWSSNWNPHTIRETFRVG